MKTTLIQYTANSWAEHASDQPIASNANLVLCFAAKESLKREPVFSSLRARYPHADIALCSTAGEIFHHRVQDDSIIAAAIELEKTTTHTASVNINDHAGSYQAAKALATQLPLKSLSYILVFSDGSMVNGTELVKGLQEIAGDKILVTGGLAGDGSSFKSTLVGLNEEPSEGKIIAIGFYGDHLSVTHGSGGGWDMFGLEKEITRSSGNILYEMDNKNALDLYKKYLGPDAEHLPESALLFPLAMTIPGSSTPVVRTILSVDEKERVMIFAGDVPVGAKVRFMRANFDSLTAAASAAAIQTLHQKNEKPGFALLVSCVGRKLVLGARTEEEVEAVAETYGPATMLTGFYSYGELSPLNDGGACRLHNPNYDHYFFL